MNSSEIDARVADFVRTMSAGATSTDLARSHDFPVRGRHKIDIDTDWDTGIVCTEADYGIPGWRARLAWHLVDGVVRLHEVAFVPSDEGSPDIAALVKKLRLGPLVRQAAQELRRPPILLTLPAEWGRALLAEVAVPRPGRRGRPLVFYAVWAAEYVRALEESKTPIKLLVERHPTETAGSLGAFLGRARREGFLTAAGDGVAGGKLTPKAKRLLRSYQQEA